MKKYVVTIFLLFYSLTGWSESEKNVIPLIQYKNILITTEDVENTSASLSNKQQVYGFEQHLGFDEVFQICLAQIKQRVIEELIKQEIISMNPQELKEMYEKEYANLTDKDIEEYNRRVEMLIKSIKEAKQNIRDEKYLRSIYTKYEKYLSPLGVPFEIWQGFYLVQDPDELSEKMTKQSFKNKQELINKAINQDDIHLKAKLLYEKLTKEVNLTTEEETLSEVLKTSTQFMLQRKKQFVYEQFILNEVLKRADFFPNNHSQRLRQKLEEESRRRFIEVLK